MSDPSPGKQSKKSHMLRPFKGLFSRRSRSPSHQPVTPDNGSASRSASPANSTTFSPQVNSRSHLGVQPVTPHNATATSPRNNATSAPEANTQGAEYTAILGLPTMPSGPLTWEHQMKEWGSTAYEGLKMAIQGIYNCSGSFPPLQTTAGVLLTISKVVDVRGSMCSTLLSFILSIREFQRIGRILNNLGWSCNPLSRLYVSMGKTAVYMHWITGLKIFACTSGLSMPVWRSWILFRAINLQIDAVEKLHGNSLWTRTLEGTKDADTVLKVFRNISSLCDVFQVSFSLAHGQGCL
jgi:hypothetical protein